MNSPGQTDLQHADLQLAHACCMTATIERMIERPFSNTMQQADAACEPPGSDAANKRLRAAQSVWQSRNVNERLQIIGRIAGIIAARGDELAQLVHRPAATPAEILASEVLPLAEACRYAGKRGGQILKPRRLRRNDAAWWMGSVQVTELREPLGIILIIAPSNYPLFLPGVQLIQALAAGNAVCIKPAPDCEEAMRTFVQLCVATGVPSELMMVLDSDPRSAEQSIASGVDKVIFTGSLDTGRLVAAQCSQHMTPIALELSGNDAVLVCDDADLQRVAQCVAYALSLNGGQTCIAPRRLFATASTIQQLIPLLSERLSNTPSRAITERGLLFARNQVNQAMKSGATVACGHLSNFEDAGVVRPIVLGGVRSDMSIVQEDIFAPLLSVIEVKDMQEAVAQSLNSRYALGAAIFGRAPAANELATQLNAGCITINDVLVPTADPRVSFGGRQASGFGTTRGLEGLRELTQLKVLCTRRGRWLPHLTTRPAQLGPMLSGILKLRHGRSWAERWDGIKRLMKAGREK